jgi:hypothetical protein
MRSIFSALGYLAIFTLIELDSLNSRKRQNLKLVAAQFFINFA